MKVRGYKQDVGSNIPGVVQTYDLYLLLNFIIELLTELESLQADRKEGVMWTYLMCSFGIMEIHLGLLDFNVLLKI